MSSSLSFSFSPSLCLSRSPSLCISKSVSPSLSPHCLLSLCLSLARSLACTPFLTLSPSVPRPPPFSIYTHPHNAALCGDWRKTRSKSCCLCRSLSQEGRPTGLRREGGGGSWRGRWGGLRGRLGKGMGGARERCRGRGGSMGGRDARTHMHR